MNSRYNIYLLFLIFCFNVCSFTEDENNCNFDNNKLKKKLNSVIKIIATKKELNSPNNDNKIGSGVIINKNGYIITNNHVISSMNYYYIATLGENILDIPKIKYIAEKITILEKIDIALLKIVGKLINIKTIKNINYLTSSYRNSFNLEYNLFDICKRKQNLGESIIMVGYPTIGNGRLIISNGIVSSIDEKKMK